HGECLACALVDDVRDLQSSLVGGLIKLEVDRPHMIRAQRGHPFGRIEAHTAPFAALGRPFQPFLAPQTLHPLAIHVPALPAHHPRGHLVTPPRMRLRDRAQLGAQLAVVDRSWRTRLTLRRPVLTRDPTREPFGDPEAHLQAAHRSPATLRGQKFPSANSLSIAFSSSASASSFFNRAFSRSSSLSRFASSAFMPPYCARQRAQLDSETSRCRSTSVSSVPSFSIRSPSRNFRTICSGVCRLRFIVMSSCPACWTSDSHERWTTIPGSRHTRPDGCSSSCPGP